MPKLDGTGPSGRGPMTGRGAGFCLLKRPGNPVEPQTGFIGLSGKPVTFYPGSPFTENSSLHVRMKRIQSALGVMQRRLNIL